MLLNSWVECVKVVVVLGLGDYFEYWIMFNIQWQWFVQYLGVVLYIFILYFIVKDILRCGYLVFIIKEFVFKVYDMLCVLFNIVFQVLVIIEWLVKGFFGDLFQVVVSEINLYIWDCVFDFIGDLLWFCDFIVVEVFRIYFIFNYFQEFFFLVVELIIFWVEYNLCLIFVGEEKIVCVGVSSGFFNLFVGVSDEFIEDEEDVFIGVS